MKSLLITGGSGLLGQYLNQTAAKYFNVYTIFNNNVGNCKSFISSKVDITNKDKIESVFNEFRPNIIIHSAAITNPRLKEGQKSKAYFKTNVTATKTIAKLSQKFNSKIIYISTDLVYAGYRGSFLKENSKLIPATLYAETKLMGEVKVKETSENFLILRTALLYGIGLNHSRCHFQLMKKNLSNGKGVQLFTDQFRTPISLPDASNIIVEIAKSDLKDDTINLGGLERLTRCEMGEVLCSIAGYDKRLIEKIKMEAISGFPKVEDVSLDIDHLRSLGFAPRSFEENIHEIVNMD